MESKKSTRRIKANLSDICNDVALNKNWYYQNGFYYNYNKELITREEFRSQVARSYICYKTKDLDVIEDVVCEHNKLTDMKARNQYMDSREYPRETKYCWILDYLMTEVPQYDWLQIFYDIIYHKSDKTYILYGISGAGKSKVLSMLQIIFGDYCKMMTIQQLSNKFNLGELLGHLVVIGDDLGKEGFGDAIGILKSMITGEKVSVERKFMHSIHFVNESNLVFGTNQLPYLDIHDDGVLRRFVLLRFEKKMQLPVADFDEFMEKYINVEQAQALLSAVQYVQHDHDYIHLLSLETALYFIRDNAVTKCDSESYEAYTAYCKRNNHKPYNATNFIKVRGYEEQIEKEIEDLKDKIYQRQREELPF